MFSLLFSIFGFCSAFKTFRNIFSFSVGLSGGEGGEPYDEEMAAREDMAVGDAVDTAALESVVAENNNNNTI